MYRDHSCIFFMKIEENNTGYLEGTELWTFQTYENTLVSQGVRTSEVLLYIYIHFLAIWCPKKKCNNANWLSDPTIVSNFKLRTLGPILSAALSLSLSWSMAM